MLLRIIFGVASLWLLVAELRSLAFSLETWKRVNIGQDPFCRSDLVFDVSQNSVSVLAANRHEHPEAFVWSLS